MPNENPTLRQIVRTFKEPRKTQVLRALLETGAAVTLVYRPRADAPESRKKFMEIGYGIPERRFRFEAGKARAVSVGLAVYVMEQLVPAHGGPNEMHFEDSEFEEVDDVDLGSLGKLPSATISEPERAFDHARPIGGEGSADGRRSADQGPRPDLPDAARRPAQEKDVQVTRPEAGTAPLGAPAKGEAPKLHTLSKDALSQMHETMIGPVPAGMSRGAIMAAVKAARDGGEG